MNCSSTDLHQPPPLATPDVTAVVGVGDGGLLWCEGALEWVGGGVVFGGGEGWVSPVPPPLDVGVVECPPVVV